MNLRTHAISLYRVKATRTSIIGATSRFLHLEKFRLNFSSWSFAVRVNLLHP